MSLRDKLTAEEWNQQEKEIEATEAAEKAAQSCFDLYSKTKSFQKEYAEAAANIVQRYLKAIHEPEGGIYIQKVGRTERK